MCVCGEMSQITNASVGCFGGTEDFRGKSALYIQDRLRTHQIYAAVLIWINYLLALLALFLTLVGGYCLGGGLAGVTWSSLPHAVWQVPNMAVLPFALWSLYYDMNIDTSNTLTWVMLALWGVLLACMVNVVHLSAICFEINNDNSTFWLENGGAWTITLLVGIICMALLDLWIARKLHVFRASLGNARYGANWTPSAKVDDGSDSSGNGGADQDWGEAPPPPPPDATNARISGQFRVGASATTVPRGTGSIKLATGWKAK